MNWIKIGTSYFNLAAIPRVEDHGRDRVRVTFGDGSVKSFEGDDARRLLARLDATTRNGDGR